MAALAMTSDAQDLLDNIDGRLHGPMPRFINKFFGHMQYTHHDGVLDIQSSSGRGLGHCNMPQDAPPPDQFLTWFAQYMSQERDGARGAWNIATSDHTASQQEKSGRSSARLLLDMTSTLPEGQVQPQKAALQPRWDQVQVVGQFYEHGGRSISSYQDGLLQLCQSANQVFASQPTRLFLHGFYVRGSLFEFWAFDRSGPYCSDVLDVRTEFLQVLSVLLSYQRMTDEELGRGHLHIVGTDPAADHGDSCSITLDQSFGKLLLDRRPVALRDGIVGHGTTCYRAKRHGSSNRNWDCLLKFKWRWARDHPEDELLRAAKNAGAWGTVSVDYYKEFESTADLRAGLRWGSQKRFTAAPRQAQDDDDHDDDHDHDHDDDDDHDHDDNNNNNNNNKNEVAVLNDGFDDYTEESGNFSFQNRILCCIVMSPIGRPLNTFRSQLELLRVFRDAIKCHQSLLRDARILHQDVSFGNIIILDAKNEEQQQQPAGILIDLDSAIYLAEGQSDEYRITGTRPFMAIGVLQQEAHTYRHDLEAFLYVFLWTIITNRTGEPPAASRLRSWSDGSWDELASRKSQDMMQPGFQSILEEFPSEFAALKPVAQDVHQLLFPVRGTALWTGTDSAPEAIDGLYNGIIHSFEDTTDTQGLDKERHLV